MDILKIDQEFHALVDMIASDEMRAKIIFKALQTMQEHPHSTPKLALEIAIQDWAK